jgi:hypothetical protein
VARCYLMFRSLVASSGSNGSPSDQTLGSTQYFQPNNREHMHTHSFIGCGLLVVLVCRPLLLAGLQAALSPDIKPGRGRHAVSRSWPRIHVKMADPDLIARLYPFADRKGWATTVVEELNPSRYVGPPPSPPPPAQPQSRQTTDPPEDDPDPYLELRFSRGPRTSFGFVLGKDPNTSDIVLVNQGGISDHHCAITFENDFNDANVYRLVVRDLKSAYGTSVAYDEKASRNMRRDFRWIVSGHPVPEDMDPIVIELHKNLKFRIVVFAKDMKTQQSIDNVNWFLQGAVSMDDLFCQLGLPSRQPTEPPSEAHTPGTGVLYLKKKLGEGTFGIVTHFWDVSDGDEYAIKEPSAKAIRERRVNENEWKKEARIMGLVSHVSWPALHSTPRITPNVSLGPHCEVYGGEVHAVAPAHL